MSKPWPVADYCTPGLSRGKLALKLFRHQDSDGEGWHYPIAEVVIEDAEEFISSLALVAITGVRNDK